MPRINKAAWKNASEATGGGFADIEPGAYKLRITSVEPHESEEFFTIYWDVADGPSKGAYASSQFPPSERIYWRESAYPYLKMKLHRLALCNPSRFHVINDENGKFDTLEEFEQDNWKAFEGAFFAAVVRRRLYTAGTRSKNPGAERTQMEIAKWLTPEEFRDSSWSKSLLADNDQRTHDVAQASVEHSMPPMPPTPTATPDLYDEDIPF